MRALYPQLFDSGMNFEDKILFKGGRVVIPKIIPGHFFNMIRV